MDFKPETAQETKLSRMSPRRIRDLAKNLAVDIAKFARREISFARGDLYDALKKHNWACKRLGQPRLPTVKDREDLENRIKRTSEAKPRDWQVDVEVKDERMLEKRQDIMEASAGGDKDA